MYEIFEANIFQFLNVNAVVQLVEDVIFYPQLLSMLYHCDTERNLSYQIDNP